MRVCTPCGGGEPLHFPSFLSLLLFTLLTFFSQSLSLSLSLLPLSFLLSPSFHSSHFSSEITLSLSLASCVGNHFLCEERHKERHLCVLSFSSPSLSSFIPSFCFSRDKNFLSHISYFAHLLLLLQLLFFSILQILPLALKLSQTLSIYVCVYMMESSSATSRERGWKKISVLCSLVSLRPNAFACEGEKIFSHSVTLFPCACMCAFEGGRDLLLPHSLSLSHNFLHHRVFLVRGSRHRRKEKKEERERRKERGI